MRRPGHLHYTRHDSMLYTRSRNSVHHYCSHARSPFSRLVPGVGRQMRAKETLDLGRPSGSGGPTPRQEQAATSSKSTPSIPISPSTNNETRPHWADAAIWSVLKTASTTWQCPSRQGIRPRRRLGITACMTSCNHRLVLCHLH
jgi:hypothetical protein